jgi:hypothetical protein
MIKLDFVDLRRYGRAEAAAALNIPETWLKRWVTARKVPHQRSGKSRGVWFTYADIQQIGELLPELMTTSHAIHRPSDDGPRVSAQEDHVAELFRRLAG